MGGWRGGRRVRIEGGVADGNVSGGAVQWRLCRGCRHWRWAERKGGGGVEVLRCRGWWVVGGGCREEGARQESKRCVPCVRVDETSACSVLRSCCCCFLPPAAALTATATATATAAALTLRCPASRSASCPADACRPGPSLISPSTPLLSTPHQVVFSSHGFRRRQFLRFEFLRRRF